MEKRDLELLYELGTLRLFKRGKIQFHITNPQDLADHSFRVVWIAMLIAKSEKVVDLEKLIIMALIHDIAETRTGDVNYLQRQYVTLLTASPFKASFST